MERIILEAYSEKEMLEKVARYITRLATKYRIFT